MTPENLEAVSALDELIPIPTAEEIRNRSKNKKRKKLITTVVVIIALLVLCSAAGVVLYQKFGTSADRGEPDILKVEPVAVRRGDFENTITGKGKLEAVTSVLVNSELGGTVKSVSVVEGQQVEKGDILFVTKNPDITELRESAASALSSAKESQADASASYNRAKKDSATADREVTRTKSVLAKAKASGDAESIANAQASLDGAKAASAGAREAISATKAGLRASQSEVDTTRKELSKIDRQIAAASVKAPISGTVIGVSVKTGSILTPAMGIGVDAQPGADVSLSAVEIADLSSMTMRTSVTEKQVVSVQVGQVAQVTFDALPGVSAEAKVVRVAPKATATDQNLEMGMPGSSGPAKYDVDIQLDNPDPRLKYGMTAQVSITVASEKNALMIPSSALIRDGSRTFVEMFSSADAQGEMREVSTSFSSQDFVVITSGLKEGDLVNPMPQGDITPGDIKPGDGFVGAMEEGSSADQPSTMEEENPLAR